jgi:hypothetical protein
VNERFEDLVDEAELAPAERERLRRVHDLLLAAGPPPEVPPELRDAPVEEPVRLLPRRRRLTLALIAAALAITAFGSGYLVGGRSGDVETVASIPMAGVGDGRGAFASIELLPEDASGNWPMNVLVRGLPPSSGRTDYYELWLTRNGKLAESCGRFTLHEGVTEVHLSVPYGLRAFDGWVVTRHDSTAPLLST